MEKKWLTRKEIEPWLPLMKKWGVSEVARSPRGFLRAYADAGWRPEGLDPWWRNRRNNFVERHMAQVEKRDEPLWRGELPSRRHLALIAWAYSPDRAKLTKAPRLANPRPVELPETEIENFVNDEIVPAVVRYLKRLPDQTAPLGEIAMFWAGRIFGLPDADGRGSFKADVFIGSKERKYNSDAAVLSGATHHRRRGEPSSVYMYLNGALSAQDFLTPTKFHDRLAPTWKCQSEGCLPWGLLTTLRHELTHAANVWPYKMTYSSAAVRAAASLPAEYINDPDEVRAWMQQVVPDARRYAKILLKAGPIDRQSLIELALKLSTTWEMVSPLLTPANEARIRRAVYQDLAERDLLP
jgi:hypothetical protein